MVKLFYSVEILLLYSFIQLFKVSIKPKASWKTLALAFILFISKLSPFFIYDLPTSFIFCHNINSCIIGISALPLLVK